MCYRYVSTFLDYETFNFWEVLNFSRPWVFFANNFISSNGTLLFFKVLKTIDFWTCVPKFLFKDCL